MISLNGIGGESGKPRYNMAYLEGIDTHWLAGFFDGEGNINIQRYTDGLAVRYGLRVCIQNSQQAILERVRQDFGGRIYLTGGAFAGHKQFQWYICGNKAKTFLRALLPFLVLKRELADKAVEFQEVVNTYRGLRLRPFELLETKHREFRALVEDKRSISPKGGNERDSADIAELGCQGDPRWA